MPKKRKYICYYHPKRDAFVDVGKSGRHFYICRKCYLKQDRNKWDRDQVQ